MAAVSKNDLFSVCFSVATIRGLDVSINTLLEMRCEDHLFDVPTFTKSKVIGQDYVAHHQLCADGSAVLSLTTPEDSDQISTFISKVVSKLEENLTECKIPAGSLLSVRVFDRTSDGMTTNHLRGEWSKK